VRRKKEVQRDCDTHPSLILSNEYRTGLAAKAAVAIVFPGTTQPELDQPCQRILFGNARTLNIQRQLSNELFSLGSYIEMVAFEHPLCEAANGMNAPRG
jgi:hypothetical protein